MKRKHDFKFGDRVKLTDKAARQRRFGQVDAIFIGRMRHSPSSCYIAIEGRISPECYHESAILPGDTSKDEATHE